MGTLRKREEEILQITITVKLKHVFDEFTSRLDLTDKIIYQLEDI